RVFLQSADQLRGHIVNSPVFFNTRWVLFRRWQFSFHRDGLLVLLKDTLGLCDDQLNFFVVGKFRCLFLLLLSHATNGKKKHGGKHCQFRHAQHDTRHCRSISSITTVLIVLPAVVCTVLPTP